MNNIFISVDAYKDSHSKLYSPKAKYICSYVEPRINKPVRFFGLQAWIKQYMRRIPSKYHLIEALGIKSSMGMPFPPLGELMNLGYFPLEIQALPEGGIYEGVPLIRIRNTHPDFNWLVSWCETSLLRAIWYSSSVATLSYNIKQDLKKYTNNVDFKLHDFGARGASSGETAAIGGAAHMLNFKGSDTEEAIQFLQDFYGLYNPDITSIPAAEHSTVTSWDSEYEAYSHQLNTYKGQMVAIVSDSYNYKNAIIELWCDKLVNQVKNHGNLVVIRPDSGDPIELIPWTLKQLEKAYGYSLCEKELKLLNHVRIIWGDGINQQTIRNICEAVIDNGYSVDNLAFGMGGALLQDHMRDDYSWAMKACAISEDGINWKPIGKLTEGKKSRQGIPLVYANTVLDGNTQFKSDYMRTVYENGRLLIDEHFTTIRDRA